MSTIMINTKCVNKPVFKLGGIQPPNKNQKTRMCKNSYNCVFGDRCHYAHKLDELKIAKCAFGDECIFINCENNIYFNKKDIKMCYFRHPEEDDMNYNIRIGNIKTTTPAPPSSPVNSPMAPRIRRVCDDDKEASLKPIKLNFDSYESNSWVTVSKKRKQVVDAPPVRVNKSIGETLCVNVDESNVFKVLGGLLDREISRVNLNIKY
jgi:hypothetical protein